MAESPKPSAEKHETSPGADPSASASGGNNTKFDMKRFAKTTAENLKWWQEHPEAMEVREREDFLRELEIPPYTPPKKGGDDKPK